MLQQLGGENRVCYNEAALERCCAAVLEGVKRDIHGNVPFFRQNKSAGNTVPADTGRMHASHCAGDGMAFIFYYRIPALFIVKALKSRA